MIDYAEATAEDFDALTLRLRNRVVDELEKMDPNIPLVEVLLEACSAIDELIDLVSIAGVSNA